MVISRKMKEKIIFCILLLFLFIFMYFYVKYIKIRVFHVFCFGFVSCKTYIICKHNSINIKWTTKFCDLHNKKFYNLFFFILN